MICLPLLVIQVSFLQMTCNCCSHDPNQAWSGEWDLPIKPKYVFMPHNLEPPSLSPSFSLRQTPIIISHRPPTSETCGFPLTRHWAAVRLRIQQDDWKFVVCRPFPNISEAAFISPYCAIMWSNLEYAMEANSLNLRTDIYLLERVHHLATRLVRGTQHFSPSL